MNTTIKTAFPLVFAASALAAGPAGAAADPAPQMRVSYADLNLATASGRATFERRISHAVDQVCGDRPLPVEINRQAAFEDCRQVAWSGARQQIATVYKGENLADASVRIRGR